MVIVSSMYYYDTDSLFGKLSHVLIRQWLDDLETGNWWFLEKLPPHSELKKVDMRTISFRSLYQLFDTPNLSSLDVH